MEKATRLGKPVVALSFMENLRFPVAVFAYQKPTTPSHGTSTDETMAMKPWSIALLDDATYAERKQDCMSPVFVWHEHAGELFAAHTVPPLNCQGRKQIVSVSKAELCIDCTAYIHRPDGLHGLIERTPD